MFSKSLFAASNASVFCYFLCIPCYVARAGVPVHNKRTTGTQDVMRWEGGAAQRSSFSISETTRGKD